MTNQIEHSPTLLVLCTFILLFSGLAVFIWGKKLPGKGVWLVGAGLLVLLAGFGLDEGLFLKETFRVKVWMVGWIWPRQEVGALTVGVMQDLVGYAMGTLAALVSSTLLFHQFFLSRESCPEKIYASLAISTAGVSLAWNSLTPWLSFSGIALTLLGGIISFGTRSESNLEANNVARFAWERASGFLLAFFGACILTTSRSALLLSHDANWIIQGEHLSSTWVGSILLVIGLFIQTQPFPLLSGIVSKSEVYAPIRVLLTQAFPAWGAFSLLIRLQPQFLSLGLFPAFGWVALGTCLLAILSGLFQNQWRSALGAWLTAGFSLSITFLAFSSRLSALGMLLGSSLGALCIAAAGNALEEVCTQSLPHQKRATGLKIASFLGACAGTGVFGFVSAAGGIHWIIQTLQLPSLIPPFLIVFFLFVLLGWRLSWRVIRLQNVSQASWLSIFPIFIWVFLSLGILWTGTATGDVLLGNPDRLFSSLFSLFFDNQAEFSNPDEYVTASSLYWGILLLAFLSAYWTSGRKEDLLIRIAGVFPRATGFLASGYGVDQMAFQMMSGVSWLGRSAEGLIDIKIWTQWIPRGLYRGITSISQVLAEIDVQISSSLEGALKRLIEIPAKILQLIQTGDLRWYLVFALSSGFALLLHYLRT